MGTVLSTFSSNDTNECGSTTIDRYPSLVHHPHQHLHPPPPPHHHHQHHQHTYPTIHTNYTTTNRKSAFDNQTLNYDRSNHAYLYEDFDPVNDRTQSPSTDQVADFIGDQNVSDTSKLTNSMNMLSLKRFIFPNLSRKLKTGTGFGRQSCKTHNSVMSRSEYRTQRVYPDGFEKFESCDSEIPVYYYPNGTTNRSGIHKWSEDLPSKYSVTSGRYNQIDGSLNENSLNLVRSSEYDYDKLATSENQQLGFHQRHVRFNPRRQLSEPNRHFRPKLASCGSGEDLVSQQTQSRVLYTYTPSLIDLRRVNRYTDSQSLNPHPRSINRNHSLRLPLSPHLSSRSSADVQIYPHGSSRLILRPDVHPQVIHSHFDSHLCTYDTSPAARSCNYNFDSRIYDGSVAFESEFQDHCHQVMNRSHNRLCSTPQSTYHLPTESYTDKQSLVQISPVYVKQEQLDQVTSDLPVPIPISKTHNEFSKSLTKSISCYALKFFNYHSTQPRSRKSTESETLFKIPKKRESSFVERTRKFQTDKRRASHILTKKDKHMMNIPTTTIPTIASNVLTTNPVLNMNSHITMTTITSTSTSTTTTTATTISSGSTSTTTNLGLINKDIIDNANTISSNNVNQRITGKDSVYGDLQQQQQRFEHSKSVSGKPLTYNLSSNYVQTKENGFYNRQLGTINPCLIDDNRSDVIDLKTNHLNLISNDLVPIHPNLNCFQWTNESNLNKSGSFCTRHSDILIRQPIYKASTNELLRCLSFFIVTRIQLRLTHGQHRLNTNLRNLQPSLIVAWIRAIDRALLLQGWSEVAFINPIHVVFLFMMIRDFVDRDIATEQELHTIIMACLYLAYSYMGNEISYPLKPFLVAETNQMIVHTDNEKKLLTTEHALIHGHENSIKSKVIDEVRNRFWQYVLRILNAKSSDMLRINADPVLFTELFGELKSYENAFNMPVKIPIRSTNRPL